MICADELIERYNIIKQKIINACNVCSRSYDEVKLVAVSKFYPFKAIEILALAGHKDFGESYVQEAMEKQKEYSECGKLLDINWHMIGHVQSRKAVTVSGNFDLVHSVDSKKLASTFEKHLEKQNITQNILLEVNVGSESQKSGIACEQLPELIEFILEKCPHLILKGLMCIPPVFDAGDKARPYFAKLRQLRDDMNLRFKIALPDLSMGMSGDFEQAIAEGATIIRIGTKIFGPRPVKK